MNSKDAEINRLVLENGKLKAENKALAESQMRHCVSCDRLSRHDCYTLHWCPFLGFVDPERDGCSRHKPRRKK